MQVQYVVDFDVRSRTHPVFGPERVAARRGLDVIDGAFVTLVRALVTFAHQSDPARFVVHHVGVHDL
ncbi:hypothetical protein MO973_40410 [Paenibacillus sp. TRM 82003]|uniref:hypothetical protein n=1 Tax=Kineococcus sp. TRM81007 TaxID=2925831 RepID=UPI001F59FE7E|nr:hypothetical protein [Kineococcus sp. TRM81007]MCI2237069.1 hypothetical protein [Kineococcus sp. TRM81007]MCI3926464.1 hypothetical protein [Paenibacillus sp. TRM 82003]